MTKYHISKTTGQPNICRATIKDCPVGDAQDHYSSKEEARAAFEERMKNETLPTPSPKRNVKKGYSLEQVEDWDNLRQLNEDIESYTKRSEEHLRHRIYLDKASEKIQQALATYEPPVELSGGGQQWVGPSNSYAREALRELRKTEPYVPNRMDPYYPNHEYPDLESIQGEVQARSDDNEMELQELSDTLDSLEEAKGEIEDRVYAQTGFRENPKYGVPSGESTKEKYAGKYARGYSTLPTKDVPVLKDAERFCTRCGDNQTVYNNKTYTTTHGNGESYCDSAKVKEHTGSAPEHRLYISMNPVCSYCGTGDPKHSSFAQRSYSDETSCSRCGGVSGYGIGD